MEKAFHTVDVFTQNKLAGNPLGVVLDAEGISDTQMQAIAQEFNLSETTFILPPENPAHSARVRIFTPKAEMPFAGHPIIGTAIVLAHKKAEALGQMQDAMIILEVEAGLVRIGVRMNEGNAPYAEFSIPVLPKDHGTPAPVDRIAAALGLAPNEIGFENHKPTQFSAGFPFCFVPVADLQAIGRAHCNMEHWGDTFSDPHPGSVFIYCRETIGANHAFHGRMFAPAFGIAEDPATGSAAAAFAGVVAKFDDLPDGSHKLIIEQGYEMKRPSHITLEMDLKGAEITDVHIGGHAVKFAEGKLFL